MGHYVPYAVFLQPGDQSNRVPARICEASHSLECRITASGQSGSRLRLQGRGAVTMSTTDRRVEQLLDRWLASVELHLRYLKLDDAAYARAEAWPKHQRPNALVVNLARTRLLELKAHLSERRDAGDAKFAESLELMSFLTSLLGSEHIERFIPLATGKSPDSGASATVEQPRIRATAKAASNHGTEGA